MDVLRPVLGNVLGDVIGAEPETGLSYDKTFRALANPIRKRVERNR